MAKLNFSIQDAKMVTLFVGNANVMLIFSRCPEYFKFLLNRSLRCIIYARTAIYNSIELDSMNPHYPHYNSCQSSLMVLACSRRDNICLPPRAGGVSSLSVYR